MSGPDGTDRSLARRELARDLLVQQPGDHERHDLALACSQSLVPLAQRSSFEARPVRRAIALDRAADRGEQVA